MVTLVIKVATPSIKPSSVTSKSKTLIGEALSVELITTPLSSNVVLEVTTVVGSGVVITMLPLMAEVNPPLALNV